MEVIKSLKHVKCSANKMRIVVYNNNNARKQILLNAHKN
jgi:hypothetical protein